MSLKNFVVSFCLLTLYASKPVFAEDTLAVDTQSSRIDEITIIGSQDEATNYPGAATVIDAEDLTKFAHADIQRILRQVPGVSIQTEDGYGLRPNLSIRGTATERSGRITLLEDNVLIAPAPYSAPSAYYFPTAGRMNEVEVLKGSASVKQGPYTVGGAMNFLSTPIPDQRLGLATLEAGENQTSRLHASYGDSGERFGWLVESHLWDSDGFQSIDRSSSDTGLDKDDWMLKLRFNSGPDANVYQQLDIKLQYATESSNQSYLGLTDGDFAANRLRRYGVSALDNIDTEHRQLIVRYALEFDSGTVLRLTAYDNRHERDWFKTEGLDADGSANAAEFSRTSWFSIIQGINRGEDAGGLSSTELQAILDGGDSAAGAIQIRSNAREYTSQGIQFGADFELNWFGLDHQIDAGVRYHEDDEDRLQRNSSYTQTGGNLVLADLGALGNAGNRLQEAQAWSAFVTDRIQLGRWTLSPGFRYESIEQQRTRWETRDGRTADPAERSAANLRSERSNDTNVFIPGMGVLFALSDTVSFYGGIHKGFTAPSNAPDVREEESLNYEFGVRVDKLGWMIDAAGFFTDYDNLLGVCTASSGNDCEVGDAFNGDAASIRGLELTARRDFALGADWLMPVSLAYTYLDGTFDSDIADTEFFGDVSDGDSLPYIPDQQWQLSLGAQKGRFGVFANYNHVDEVCVRASCEEFERTESQDVIDLVARFDYSEALSVYARLDNAFDDDAILGRQPYGARPGRDRSAAVGFNAQF